MNTTNVMRILLPQKAQDIQVKDHLGNNMQVDVDWDDASKTCFLSFENYPDGVNVKLSW